MHAGATVEDHAGRVQRGCERRLGEASKELVSGAPKASLGGRRCFGSGKPSQEAAMATRVQQGVAGVDWASRAQKPGPREGGGRGTELLYSEA